VKESTYTEAEVARLQDSEVKLVLRGLVASLERVKAQRARSLELARTKAERAGISGEITGLIIAINAIKRRLR
jgi:hypothetical protein